MHIDVPQHQIGGIGTAMRFELPIGGHNFPLCHRYEHKLILALEGTLDVHAGQHSLGRLDRGRALVLPPNSIHRIDQLGSAPAVVGVALWPGKVEFAFREIATMVNQQRFKRDSLISILAKYGVNWLDKPTDQASYALVSPLPIGQALDLLPSSLASAIQLKWNKWISG